MISQEVQLLLEDFKKGEVKLSPKSQELLTLTLMIEVERMQKELAVRREQELHLEYALCSIADGVAVTNKVGQIRLFNPAFSELVNCADLDSNFWSFWKNNNESKDLQVAVQTQKDWSGLLCQKSNSHRVQVKASPITAETGMIDRWVFTLKDQEESLRLHEKISGQKLLLERILDAMDGLVFVINKDQTRILDNLAAKTLLTDLKDTTEAELLKILTTTRASNSKPKRLECQTLQGKKSFVYAAQEIPSEYFFEDKKKENMILVTMTDLTELENKEQELQIKNQSLKLRDIKTSLAQSTFAKGVLFRLHSHLHQAEAALKGLAQIEAFGVTRTAEHLKNMHQELDSYRALKPEEVQFSGSCDSHVITKSLEIMYSEIVDLGGYKLRIETESNLDLPVTEMGMLLISSILVDNAFESLEKRDTGFVKIKFKTNLRGKVFTVEDSGSGVPETQQAKIFEPLNTTKKGHQGLSLTLLHRILDDLGCSLEFFNSSLGGAGFKIIFPEAD
ncbi:MAG: ATP-binding protein [SAR324 cluster bacterium]|nr:ATP-binding protein [SAR324 cluster bacterium]